MQPAETVAANIVRHGGFLREKRTGPAGTHPPRFCGARGAAADAGPAPVSAKKRASARVYFWMVAGLYSLLTSQATKG